MKTVQELKEAAKQALEFIQNDRSVIEAVVYVSTNRRVVGRIIYTTHIPCNGLEEPKSDEDLGITVEVWFRKNNKKLLGFGHESNDISLNAVRRAFAKAKRDAIEDPDFIGFLKPKDFPEQKTKKQLKYHDRRLLEMDEQEEAEVLAKISWETIQGAVDVIKDYTRKKGIKDIDFVLNGDNFFIKEKMALATSNGIFDWDETTVVLSFLTAVLEEQRAKGSAWGAHLKLDGISPYNLGRKAALAAISGIGGKKIKSGQYNVVFGPQAVTEIMSSLLLPHMSLGIVEFGASLFNGQFGKKVASEILTIYDDATLPEGAGSKKITCEGCPTGKTLLIDKGRLVGYLADSRTYYKVLKRRKEATKKIGVDPHEIRHAIAPNNGFRFARGGGRVAEAGIGISATNLIIDTHKPSTEGEILQKVKNGVYIGRLWYTYPVGGLSTGIISGTAIADCYIIKNGKFSTPILPNSIRLEDNIGRIIKNIIAIGGNQTPTILWATDEITHAPWVAVKDVNLLEVKNI